MSNEFKVHRLNVQGLVKADRLANAFATCLAEVEGLVPAGHELSLVVTKMQEACFFAKRGIALDRENQL